MNEDKFLKCLGISFATGLFAYVACKIYIYFSNGNFEDLLTILIAVVAAGCCWIGLCIKEKNLDCFERKSEDFLFLVQRHSCVNWLLHYFVKYCRKCNKLTENVAFSWFFRTILQHRALVSALQS